MRSSILNKKSIKFKILSFIVNLILLCNLTFYQIVSVYAMPAEEDVMTNLYTENLWTVIDGGGNNNLETEIIQNPSLFSAEIDSGIALGMVARQAFWDEMNATIRQKIQDGTLSAEDVGTVYYKNIGGTEIPIAIVHNAVYGSNEYLITRELAQKILDEQLRTDEEVQAAVIDYWDRVVASDVQPFIDLANNMSNWVTKFKAKSVDLWSEIYWKLFGVNATGSLDADFLNEGIWLRFTNNYDTVYTYRVGSSYVNTDFEYLCIYVSDWSGAGSWANGRCAYQLWYYDPSWNTFAFQKVTEITPYRDDIKFVNIPSEFYKISESTYSDFNDLIEPGLWPEQISFSTVFPNWDEIGHIYLPGNDPLVNPLVNPDACYALDDIEDAVGLIADAVDEARELNPNALPEINPETLPDLAPILDPNRGLNPDTGLDPDRFIDPVPGSGGDTPGGGDGGDDPPGGGGSDDPKPGERPKLKIPQLLTLFPFCIPFDIKKSIQLFQSDSTGPVFNVPIHIEYGGHVIVDYTFVLDLTSYGIDTAIGYIKAVEIIAYIVILCCATYKVIF